MYVAPAPPGRLLERRWRDEYACLAFAIHMRLEINGEVLGQVSPHPLHRRVEALSVGAHTYVDTARSINARTLPYTTCACDPTRR